MKPHRGILSLAVWLMISYLAAALGSAASINAADFYAQLDQPAWSPPAGVFGPVWSVLYTMMGISVWLVWRKSGFKQAPLSILLFLSQLAVNSLWSWVFFQWQRGALSMLTIVLLWGLILATLLAFRKHSLPAALLLTPYLLWVTFATALTFHLWQNNPGML